MCSQFNAGLCILHITCGCWPHYSVWLVSKFLQNFFLITNSWNRAASFSSSSPCFALGVCRLRSRSRSRIHGFLHVFTRTLLVWHDYRPIFLSADKIGRFIAREKVGLLTSALLFFLICLQFFVQPLIYFWRRGSFSGVGGPVANKLQKMAIKNALPLEAARPSSRSFLHSQGSSLPKFSRIGRIATEELGFRGLSS